MRSMKWASAACLLAALCGSARASGLQRVYTIALDHYCNIFQISITGDLAVGRDIGCDQVDNNLVGTVGHERGAALGYGVVLIQILSNGAASQTYLNLSARTFAAHYSRDGVSVDNAQDTFSFSNTKSLRADRAKLPNYLLPWVSRMPSEQVPKPRAGQ